MTRKIPFVCIALWSCASTASARPTQSLKVPLHMGVYVADVRAGRIQSVGDFSDWKLSPDGRFCVGGRNVGLKKPFYEVSVVSTSGGLARRLERFPVSEEMSAIFHWSPDSSRVSVSADRNDDSKMELKTFGIARPHPVKERRGQRRQLSVAAMRRLNARFPHVSDVTFSPDGSRVVAYLSRSSYDKPDFDGGLWMFAPDGTGLRRLTRNVGLSRHDLQTGVPLASHDLDDREPVWLDSNRLAFRRTSYEDES